MFRPRGKGSQKAKLSITPRSTFRFRAEIIPRAATGGCLRLSPDSIYNSFLPITRFPPSMRDSYNLYRLLEFAIDDSEWEAAHHTGFDNRLLDTDIGTG